MGRERGLANDGEMDLKWKPYREKGITKFGGGSWDFRNRDDVILVRCLMLYGGWYAIAKNLCNS